MGEVGLVALLALGIACAGESLDIECAGKCDDPGATRDRECEIRCEGDPECVDVCVTGAGLTVCEARRTDALDDGRGAFTRDFIRWAASSADDDNIVDGDAPGHEYTEYFAIVQTPPSDPDGALGAPQLLGKPTGRIVEFDDNGDLTRSESISTPRALELDDRQVKWLCDNGDQVIGQCVFTSWHRDIPSELACSASQNCPDVLGVSVDATVEISRFNGTSTEQVQEPVFRMVAGFNANAAAADLVQRCMRPGEPGDAGDAQDPHHDDFTRGCMLAAKTGANGVGTHWRRSDSAICAASMRLAECGCGVDTNADGVVDLSAEVMGRLLIPRQPDANGNVSLRGFRLGTWAGIDQLPEGCRYVDIDGDQTLVTCDLTAADVLAKAGDVDDDATLVACDPTAADMNAKASDAMAVCRKKYGRNIVVHVPVPADVIVCDPPQEGHYAESCSDMPWVLEPISGAVF